MFTVSTEFAGTEEPVSLIITDHEKTVSPYQLKQQSPSEEHEDAADTSVPSFEKATSEEDITPSSITKTTIHEKITNHQSSFSILQQKISVQLLL
ncbi:hypothetical protein CEXT_777131 [Caerostris extrusa]|uniref:Uncharacterized protein n=1 Tax=Caerostris extrusa TaxID=172846 RepID=A0AAV4V509_CAEEX|nr:hypothetical protein CEXT_777131 [Caerostris extrusa]